MLLEVLIRLFELLYALLEALLLEAKHRRWHMVDVAIAVQEEGVGWICHQRVVMGVDLNVSFELSDLVFNTLYLIKKRQVADLKELALLWIVYRCLLTRQVLEKLVECNILLVPLSVEPLFLLLVDLLFLLVLIFDVYHVGVTHLPLEGILMVSVLLPLVQFLGLRDQDFFVVKRLMLIQQLHLALPLHSLNGLQEVLVKLWVELQLWI